jgi:hypothetical protein
LRGGYDGNPNPDCSVTDKIKACKDLYEGHGCCWTWQGVVQYGKCRANPPDYELHCSDLN